MSRRILYVAMLVVLVASLVGCGPKATTTTSGKIKVGLSFSDYATERWPIEAGMMTKLLQAKGYEVLVAEADHDVKLQSDQIDNMVSQGVKGLIIIAEDGDAAVTPVEKAAAAGVKVIAYDRLIKTSKISAYLSFDNVEVGKAEADGVVKALGLDKGNPTWTSSNPVKMVLSGGSPTDNNAILVRGGQMQILQPYIDKGVVKIVADQWVENWDAAKAEAMMENILTGDRYLAGQSLGFHRLQFAQRGTIVRGHHCIDLVLLCGENVFHHRFSLGGIPVLHPLVGYNFNDA